MSASVTLDALMNQICKVSQSCKFVAFSCKLYIAIWSNDSNDHHSVSIVVMMVWNSLPIHIIRLFHNFISKEMAVVPRLLKYSPWSSRPGHARFALVLFSGLAVFWANFATVHLLSPIRTTYADATQLSSWVASEMRRVGVGGLYLTLHCTVYGIYRC